MISATELRPGMIVIYGGELHRVHSVLHKTPGNLRGFVQAKLRSLRSGAMNEHRFRSEDRIEKATSSGIAANNLIIDPGIGFGKSVEDNLRLLRHLGEFKALGRPICVGVSRKHFTGKITGVSRPADRIEGTAAAVTAAVLNGASIIRVHDVGIMKRVVAMADAVRRVR